MSVDTAVCAVLARDLTESGRLNQSIRFARSYGLSRDVRANTAGHASTTNTAITCRVFIQILLVIPLGVVEISCCLNLCRDAAVTCRFEPLVVLIPANFAASAWASE